MDIHVHRFREAITFTVDMNVHPTQQYITFATNYIFLVMAADAAYAGKGAKSESDKGPPEKGQ